jgi:hypothetical protein
MGASSIDDEEECHMDAFDNCRDALVDGQVALARAVGVCKAAKTSRAT